MATVAKTDHTGLDRRSDAGAAGVALPSTLGRPFKKAGQTARSAQHKAVWLQPAPKTAYKLIHRIARPAVLERGQRLD